MNLKQQITIGKGSPISRREYRVLPAQNDVIIQEEINTMLGQGIMQKEGWMLRRLQKI